MALNHIYAVGPRLSRAIVVPTQTRLTGGG
jgi:hypothetical protein